MVDSLRFRLRSAWHNSRVHQTASGVTVFARTLVGSCSPRARKPRRHAAAGDAGVSLKKESVTPVYPLLSLATVGASVLTTTAVSYPQVISNPLCANDS